MKNVQNIVIVAVAISGLVACNGKSGNNEDGQVRNPIGVDKQVEENAKVVSVDAATAASAEIKAEVLIPVDNYADGSIGLTTDSLRQILCATGSCDKNGNAIIPNQNAGQYIRNAVNSYLAQRSSDQASNQAAGDVIVTLNEFCSKKPEFCDETGSLKFKTGQNAELAGAIKSVADEKR